jgi:hypothetical protein
MKTIVSCPECRRDLQVPDELLGRSVQCPDCKHPFTAQSLDAPIPITSVSKVPAPAPPTATAAPAAPAVPTKWEEPARPAEQRRRDDRDDDLDDLRVGRRRSAGVPDRGAIILTLGIVSLSLALFSFLLYIIPIWLIPLVVGVFGWVLGQRDLRAMRDGTMDSSNQVMTLVGMILSIVGVGISACVGLLGCGVAALIGIMISIGAMAGPPRPPGPPPRRM